MWALGYPFGGFFVPSSPSNPGLQPRAKRVGCKALLGGTRADLPDCLWNKNWLSVLRNVAYRMRVHKVTIWWRPTGDVKVGSANRLRPVEIVKPQSRARSDPQV